MSGTQVSGFADPNILYKSLSGLGTAEVQYKQNELLQQQQTLGAGDTEMAARIASTLQALPTPEARASAYPTMLAQARASGYRLPHAPETYPGDDAIAATARLGTPSADLFKLGIDRQAKGAIAPGDDGTTATGGTGGGGGGTGTVGGADTAPINAAGDSRTRKAAEGGPPAAGSPGAAVAQQVHDFWISKGFSEPVVAGIMAGGPGSESNFTPTVFGDKGTSYGLYQHHGPRLDAMRQFFGLSGSQNPTADQQNQYAAWEISPAGPLAKVGEMLKNAKTAAEGAAIWTQYFGVPADKSEIGRRAAGAQRFVGLYGQPQQGGPGSSTAPAVVTGDVARPGAVPPPPWGAPGAYGGGGMGAAIGGQPAAARATVPAGRPTGPPVVTDQPAGGGVVAGPPGTAVVGQPVPASPAVAGNVDAINAGIVARGGQPATDPNLTPTPARYAGTAPAPSVEAAPQPGWGTGIGSGYGPQNALAPAPVQPAPARPAAPAAVATATQPPAADTLPPLPAPTPPAPTNRNGLTPFQQQDIDRRRNMPTVSADELQKRVDSYVATNAAVAEKFQQDQIAYVREMRERQTTAGAAAHQTLEEQRQAAADAALAEQRRIENQRQQESAARDAQRLALEQKKAEQGSSQEDRDYYNLRTEDPSSQKYADSYVNRKWTVAPNGNVIENDMSRYPAPNRSIQRPSFVPAPTPQGLDEVRKADTDAKVITSAIDHYTDVFSATGGGGWDAYFANPKDPKTQQLLGAFDRMKTVLRSPVYYNTGVLQPAEINLMSQDLVSPQSLRGVFSTPQALATRLAEIKLAVLTRQDAELRSIGRDGVIVRDKADFAKIPAGGRYYDENGNLRVKPEN